MGLKLKQMTIQEYDEAFDKMYEDLLSQDLTVEEFNVAYDKWVEENEPKVDWINFKK